MGEGIAIIPHGGQEEYGRVATRLILHFDGGSRGNPGPGYGSYVLLRGRREVLRRAREFGPSLTNNEAEYEALLAGLADALKWLQREGIDPGHVTLEVRGDSQLVIRQLQGVWKAREPRMAALRDRALALLRRFGRYDLRQVPRRRSVEVLGH
jgi:ribonuclease HI